MIEEKHNVFTDIFTTLTGKKLPTGIIKKLPPKKKKVKRKKRRKAKKKTAGKKP